MKMKAHVILIFFFVLLGCVRIDEPEKTERLEIEEQVNAGAETEVYAFNTVLQTRGDAVTAYWFDQNDNIIFINNSGKVTYFFYDENKLVRIKGDAGEKNLNYKEGGLSTAVSKYETAEFVRDVWGRLTGIEDGEKVSFSYDPNDRLSSFRRGSGVPTTFEYDEEGRIKNFTKALTTTKAYYDDNGRLKLLDTQNNFLVIAYWREDLLSSLSGDVYGLKETISYNQNDIKLISATDESVFTGELERLKIKALNLYLFCKKFKKAPIVFDALSYTLFHDYFDKEVEGYIVTNYYCGVFE